VYLETEFLSRKHCAPSVIFVGNGRPEKRHEAVA
jgi:hypothetical protein